MINKEYIDNIKLDIDKRVQNVVELLKRSSLKVSCAESCTGGMLSAALTKLAGVSSVFEFSVCCYSNSAKEKHLGVNGQTLAKFGAVSEETALEMASGIIKASGADIGLSVTGIAGPDGGTPDKPVGTVYIAAVYKDKSECRRLSINPIDREYIRAYSVNEVLKLAQKIL
ncbi:MAG: CinA family protein [Oscillospiraceae bacterium]|nr:CinA family protein [Oscillospiraceae bacterium]